VTTAHNVAPWLFPKYYSEPFIAEMNETHTHYTIELRSSTGEIFTQYDLQPVIYHHPDRDLAVLHLHDEENSLSFLKQLNFRVLETESYSPADNEELIFHGHEVFDGNLSRAFDEGGNDSTANLTLSAPRTVSGIFCGRTQYQVSFLPSSLSFSNLIPVCLSVYFNFWVDILSNRKIVDPRHVWWNSCWKKRKYLWNG
jgi:hypothetical protein